MTFSFELGNKRITTKGGQGASKPFKRRRFLRLSKSDWRGLKNTSPRAIREARRRKRGEEAAHHRLVDYLATFSDKYLRQQQAALERRDQLAIRWATSDSGRAVIDSFGSNESRLALDRRRARDLKAKVQAQHYEYYYV